MISMLSVLGLQLKTCKWNRPQSSVITYVIGEGSDTIRMFSWSLFQAVVRDLGVNIVPPLFLVIQRLQNPDHSYKF